MYESVTNKHTFLGKKYGTYVNKTITQLKFWILKRHIENNKTKNSS